MTDAVFVYGTLKRGECRGNLWPRQPVSVRTAWTRGTLFAGSDYPAMTIGSDRVLGELWTFQVGDIAAVLETLDEIEGTNQPGEPDLYRRVRIETWNLGEDCDLGEETGDRAHTYHYAKDPSQDGFVKLEADRDGFVAWSAAD